MSLRRTGSFPLSKIHRAAWTSRIAILCPFDATPSHGSREDREEVEEVDSSPELSEGQERDRWLL